MDASKRIDEKIRSLEDWRGTTLAAVRRIVREAVPDVVEEWKWMGTPTWSRNGILCIANAHTRVVKVTFPKGALLPDPEGIFNAMLGGNAWRAIDFSEGDRINERGLKRLILAAVAVNETNSVGGRSVPRRSTAARRRSTGGVAARRAR
jgi:hypothetical protein